MPYRTRVLKLSFSGFAMSWATCYAGASGLGPGHPGSSSGDLRYAAGGRYGMTADQGKRWITRLITPPVLLSGGYLLLWLCWTSRELGSVLQ